MYRGRIKCAFFFPVGFRDQKAVALDQVLDAHNPTGDCVHLLASAGFPSGVLGLKSDASCALNPTVVVFLPSGKLAGSIYPSLGIIADGFGCVGAMPLRVRGSASALPEDAGVVVVAAINVVVVVADLIISLPSSFLSLFFFLFSLHL